jgi:hypothetical protein
MPRYVEKIRVRARVARLGDEPVEGFFSLAPLSPWRAGPETILELVNADRRVIPFLRAPDEATLLLTRLAIDWIETGPDVDIDLVRPRTYRVTREERVEIRLTDDTRLEGLVQMELPDELNRLSDFLNCVEDFFPLLSRGRTLLVNKSKLRETRAFEASPLPINPGV